MIEGRLSAIVNSEGERIQYSWNGDLLSAVVQIGEGNPTHSFTYSQNDAPPRLYTVRHFNPRGGQTDFLVDDLRRVLEVRRVSTGELRTLQWQENGIRPLSITEFDGTTTQFPDWVDDDPATIVEPSGNVLALTYEPSGINFIAPRQRAIAGITDSLGLVVSNTYDAFGRPETQTNGEQETTQTAYTEATLDSVTLASGNAVDFPLYGQQGHWLEATSAAIPDVPVRRRFDAVGNPTIRGAGVQEGGVLERVYGPNRQVERIEVAATDEAGAITATDSLTLERRSDGQLLRVLRPHGAEHELEYDTLGRLIRLRELTDGVWHDTTQEYNALGQVTRIDRPNGMHEEFTFDDFGRATGRKVFRDGVLDGEVTFTWMNGRIERSYDSVRNQEEIITYDFAGRPQVLTYTALGESVTYTYDLRSRRTGKLYQVGNLTRDIRTEWDLANRRSRLYTFDEAAQEQDLALFDYDGGRLKSITYGNGLKRDALFDPTTGALTGYRTVDALAAEVERTTIANETLSSPSRLQYTSETVTALATTKEEYWLNRPGNLQTPEGRIGGRVFRWRGFLNDVLAREEAYVWDELSNLRDDSDGDSFVYNTERSRLISASVNGGAHSYSYDEAGFVTSRDGLEIAWSPMGGLARVGPAGSPLVEIEWDMGGRPVSIAALGEKRTFALFGGLVEYDAASQTVGELHLVHLSLPFVGEARRYRHLDSLGNVSTVSNELGVIISHRRYHPFGLDAVFGTDSFGAGEPRGFVGGVELRHNGVETGLVVLGARVLDSHIGRFLSQDPVFQTLNQYVYANGNPVTYIDADGRLSTARAESGPAAAEALAAALDAQAAELDAQAASLEAALLKLAATGGALLVFGGPGGKLIGGAIGVAVGFGFAAAGQIKAKAARLRANASSIRAAQAAENARTRMPPPPPPPKGIVLKQMVAPRIPDPNLPCGPSIAPPGGGGIRTLWIAAALLLLLSLMIVDRARRVPFRSRGFAETR